MTHVTKRREARLRRQHRNEAILDALVVGICAIMVIIMAAGIGVTIAIT